MNASEFLHWLDGYSLSFENGVPTADQFKIIRQKANELRIAEMQASTSPRQVGLLASDLAQAIRRGGNYSPPTQQTKGTPPARK